jgi:hypothetical protein
VIIVEVSFDEPTMEKLKEFADESGLKIEGVIEIVMRQFCSDVGGRVYTGRWSKGEVDGVKGFRYVVQWPYRPGFLEATGDLVKKWRSE